MPWKALCDGETDLPWSPRILRIKHLESDYGEILDWSDLVGEVFDDRAPSGENRTSIVRVACYLPSPSECRNSTRSDTLMPESSASSKKRPLQHSPPNFVPDALAPLPTTEGASPRQSSITIERPNKRQKLRQDQHSSGTAEFGQGELQNLAQSGISQGHRQFCGSHPSPRSEGTQFSPSQ